MPLRGTENKISIADADGGIASLKRKIEEISFSLKTLSPKALSLCCYERNT